MVDLPADFVIPTPEEFNVFTRLRTWTDERLDEHVAFCQQRHQQLTELDAQQSDPALKRMITINAEVAGAVERERQRRTVTE